MSRGKTAAVFVAMTMTACGGDATSSAQGGASGAPGPSGIPSNTRLADLTDSQVRQLCDWAAAQEGGYGTAHTCGGGITIRTYASQEDCFQRTRASAGPTCAATVGDIEACEQVLASDACNTSAPECANLIACHAP